MSSCTGVRIGLVSVLALLLTAVAASELRSQPRGGVYGGAGGAPRSPSVPTPGVPSIPRPNPGVPTIPRPTIPPPVYTPPPPPPTGGFVYVPPRPQTSGTVTVWSCDKCNARLGTGAKPNLSACPQCGVRFRDTAATGTAAAPESRPVTTPAYTAPLSSSSSGSGSRSGGTVSPAVEDDGSAERIGRTLILIFGGVFLGFVVLAAGLFTTAVVRSNRSPVTHRRPRAMDLD